MTLNQFKRKYENLSFDEYARKCQKILHELPPDPEQYESEFEFTKDLRAFEMLAMVRLENGGY